MSWNYRMVCHPSKEIEGLEIGYEYYGIHEVYYDENGNPDYYAINACPMAETAEELKNILNMMQKGVEKEILDEKIFEKF